MKLNLSAYAFLAGGLALLDGVQAADLAWKPISFKLDPMTAIVQWGRMGNYQWKSSFGGVTDPVNGQVGWGPSQRILDTNKDVPAGMMSDSDAVGFLFPNFFGTEVQIYGGRTPEPPSGSAIFRATINNSAADASAVHNPGPNGSAFSVDLPLQNSYVKIMAAGAGGIYTVDAIGVTMQIMTNYSSVDMIPQVTEFFVANSTLNPRLRWTNAYNKNSWKVQKGVADPQATPASGTAPAALSTASASPVATAAATGVGADGEAGAGNAGNAGNGAGAGGPAAALGPEDFYQAVVSSDDVNANCFIPIPSGTSFIVVNGTTGPSRGNMKVQVSPSPPNDSRHWISGDSTNNASNPWVANTVLYLRELDPTVSYTATLEAGLGSLGLYSITYYYGLAPATNGTVTANTSKPNTAAIVGGVVGGVVGGLLIAAAALYFCVWKPRKRRDREEAARDAEIENAGFTPFVQQQEVDGGTLVVPPSYDPAWVGGGSSSSSPSAGANSDSPLLPTPINEKQQLAASGPAVTSPANSPNTPDWKAPYLPQSAGGAVLGGTTGAAAEGRSGKKGLFGRTKGAASTGSGEKSSTSRNTQKTEQSGYSEGMLRAMNPDGGQ